MKLSARNVISGKVVSIRLGAVAASVKVDIGGVITSTVTVEAVEDLGLREGLECSIVIKSSEVILATDLD